MTFMKVVYLAAYFLMVAPVFGGQVITTTSAGAGGQRRLAVSGSGGLKNSILTAANNFMNVITSPWLSGFVSVVFGLMVIGYLVSGKTEDLQVGMFKLILGVSFIMMAPVIASLFGQIVTYGALR